MTTSQMATGSTRAPSTGTYHLETTGAVNPGLPTLKEILLENTGEDNQRTIGGNPVLTPTGATGQKTTGGVIRRTTGGDIWRTIGVTRVNTTEGASTQARGLATLRTTGEATPGTTGSHNLVDEGPGLARRRRSGLEERSIIPCTTLV